MKIAVDGPKDFDFHHDLPPGPFRHVIDVGWGDTDPAQIAYTSNIPAWALRAIEAWFKACVGVGWYELNIDLGVGTPFVNLACTFHAPITPRHDLRMDVTVTRIGRTSLTCGVAGYQEQGKCCFSGEFVCVFIDSVRVNPVVIPKQMRANIRRFADAQGSSFDDSSGQ